jgi:hypothetical protein
MRRPIIVLAVAALCIACAMCASKAPAGRSLAGDWDAYFANGSTSLPGFEGWRRQGYAHFAQNGSATTGTINRRTGETVLPVAHVEIRRDSIILTGDTARGVSRSAAGTWHGDTLDALFLADGKPADRRVRLVRRTTPFTVEKNYVLWPGAVSDSQYAVTEDTLVFMTTRDGAKLASYVARPVGNGPFGVVMQRTPYTRILHPAGRFWASRGYIFVA